MQRIYVTIRPLNREDSVLYFPPEAFGPFRVLHQIGAGTLGPVFRAHEPAGQQRDRLVAVKVFRLDLTPQQSTSLVDALNAIVAADISHPHIAAPIAAGLEHGAAYLAQEYAVGDSLDVVLREKGAMPIASVADLVDALADAIDHAADKGVHHGSLHLRDIILAADGARVTGFGIAAALTKVGAKLPTRPQYSSPDGPSDVYSLAAIAFEAATGRRASIEKLGALEDLHGASVRDVFAAALAADRTARPARAAQFARQLREAIGEKAGLKASTTSAVSTTEEADLKVSTTSEVPALVEPVEPLEPLEPLKPLEPLEPLEPQIELGDPLQASVDDVELVRESGGGRWQIAMIFVVVALAAAFAVTYFLRSSEPRATGDAKAGVDETTVELPAGPAPQSPAPARESAPPARSSAPAPAPSRPASGAPRSQTGSMLIRSSPADADVIVNGRERGKTPLTLRDLAFGSYTIRIALDGYAPEERTLQVTARRPAASTTINLRRAASAPRESGRSGPGGLNVQSRPAGASVFVNDRPAGTTPVSIPELAAGSAVVRIELTGYQPWITTVRIGAGEQTRVSASLERK